MSKPYYKDCTNPPGQIVAPVGYTEQELLAMSALSTPKAKTLGDIINKDHLSTKSLGKIIDKCVRQTQEEKREEELKAAKAEAYTQGYYDGVLEERHKWINQSYHQDHE